MSKRNPVKALLAVSLVFACCLVTGCGGGAASSTPASSTPASSAPASSTPASSVPASSTPASSAPASSAPAAEESESEAPDGAQETAVILLPEDADFEHAPDVIIEEYDEVDNLGGWKAANMVYWDFSLPEDGMYSFHIEYSRPTLQGPDVNEELRFRASPTGSDSAEDDWSVYVIHDNLGMRLAAGSYTLYIEPNPEEWDSADPEHFINLRSIRIIKD